MKPSRVTVTALWLALGIASGCTSAPTAAQDQTKMMSQILDVAAELHSTDWTKMDTGASCELVRRHFGGKGLVIIKPGPDEDAGSVAWRGEAHQGTCIWCVALLEEKPSRGGKLDRVNFFFASRSKEELIDKLRGLQAVVAPSLCGDTAFEVLASQLAKDGQARTSCWPAPEARVREGVEMAGYPHHEQWIGFVSYWKR